MFEREIKFIYDFNVNQVKKLGTSFTFNSLLNVNLHPSILNYISAEIDYLIYEDRKRLIENSNFDYSGEDIKKYFVLINKEIRKGKKLSIEYIDQLIIHATSFTANFLVQPKWALTKLVFEKENTASVKEVLQILKYPHYYNHLRELLERFVIKKRLVSIDKTEFENLIDKIYSHLFEIYSEKMMDDAINSMADFFNIGGINKTKIPLSTVDLFLKERKLTDYLERLNYAFPEEIKQNFSIVELRKILYSPIPVQNQSYFDKVINQEAPINYSPNEDQSVITENEEIVELNENPVPEEVIGEQVVIEPQNEKTLTEAEQEIIEKVENEIATTATETKVEFEKQILEPEDEKNIDENIATTETIYSSGIDLEEKGNDEIPKAYEENILPSIPENIEIKNEVIQKESKDLVTGAFAGDQIDEQKESFDQFFQEDKIPEDIIDKEVSDLQLTADKEIKEEFIVDNELKTEQVEIPPDEFVTPTIENITDNNQSNQDAGYDYSEITSSEQIESNIVEQKTEQFEINEIIENDILLEDLNKNEVEELDLQSIFDDDDFIVLGEEKINVSFDKIDIENLVEHDLNDNVEVKSAKQEFNFLEEKNISIEKKTIQEVNNEISKENTSDDIIKEFEEEIVSTEVESKVINEIDKEINMLSIYSEQENVIEELNSEKEEGYTDTKNSFNNVNEILNEPMYNIEKDEKELLPLEEDRELIKFEKDISYFFKGKNIDKIISEIFDDDAEDFAHTFENLSECRNLQEALTILNGLFKTNHIKPSSKEAVLVTDIITEYFNQK